MKISDFACPSCGASYEVAESMSAEGSPGRAECTICGQLLESWQEPKIKAYRLVLSSEHKYPHIPAPPSPIVT
jgi:transcription elongation factor Elf1